MSLHLKCFKQSFLFSKSTKHYVINSFFQRSKGHDYTSLFSGNTFFFHFFCLGIFFSQSWEKIKLMIWKLMFCYLPTQTATNVIELLESLPFRLLYIRLTMKNSLDSMYYNLLVLNCMYLVCGWFITFGVSLSHGCVDTQMHVRFSLGFFCSAM